MPQTPVATMPSTGTAGSMPQGAGGANPGSATGAAIVAVPVPALPANGSSSQGLTAPAASLSGGNDPSAVGSGGPSGSTLLGSAAASAAIHSQMPPTTNSSVGTMSPVAQPNAASLVPIASSTSSPAAAGTDPGPLVPTGRQLGSAIGVATGLAADPGAAGAVLLPTPLAASSPLPPIQSINTLNAGADADPIGIQPASGVQPTSLPEPGGLALFAVIACALAMKRVIRHLP